MDTSDSTFENILDQVRLVVYQTRMVSSIRDTGEGQRDGSRYKKVLQSCFDVAALRDLTRKKQEAYRLCRNFGTHVTSLNAWAVPVQRTAELMAKLAVIEAEWKVLAETMATTISAKVRQHASAFPEDASAILALAPTPDDVRSTTRFIYTSFRVRGEDIEDHGSLGEDLTCLAGQTLHEFSMVLKDASVNKGSAQHYTQGIKEVLGKIQRKASSLAFLDPILKEISDVLTDTLAVLPLSGNITSAHAVMVRSIIDQLLAPGPLMKNGFQKMQQEIASGDLFAPTVPVDAVPHKPVLVPMIARSLVVPDAAYCF